MNDADAFRRGLTSPVQSTLFDYWQHLRGDRLMPAWSDIRPEEIAIVLPHIWVWRVTGANEVRLRLVGESIYQALSRNLRGKMPEDLYPAPFGARISERLLTVARTPVCSYTTGAIFHGPDKIGDGDRLALPYSDKEGGLGVIGASTLSPLIDPDTGQPQFVNPKAFFNLVGDETLLRLAPGRAPATDH
jgi:hypothetical protein